MNGPAVRRTTAAAVTAMILMSATAAHATGRRAEVTAPALATARTLPDERQVPLAAGERDRPSRSAPRDAAGVGDPYFPQAGNPGYDVADYQVALRYFPKSRQVRATVAVTATATTALRHFHLDFRGPRVRGVTVDGRGAGHRRNGQELIVSPARRLRSGQRFRTVVRYAGVPKPRKSKQLGSYGWISTRDGAVTMSEPDGTPTWLPVNDHPSDKATYTFRVTVPKGLRVLANGLPQGPVTGRAGNRRRARTTTYVWRERVPMASYLAMIAIGRFHVRRGSAGNLPVITAVDPRFRKAGGQLFDRTVQATRWAASVFGPYPFSSTGGIVDDPVLDYALETQERPVYAGFAPSNDFVVHEIAHQWFGNSVSLFRWRDIWLNEGFATYAEWLWDEQHGKQPARRTFARMYAKPETSKIFAPPPGRPGSTRIFSESVYVRGAMALHAMRERVGDRAFFDIIRKWTSVHRGGNARTEDFVNLAEYVSGRRLDRLFRVWLYQKGKPRTW